MNVISSLTCEDGVVLICHVEVRVEVVYYCSSFFSAKTCQELFNEEMIRSVICGYVLPDQAQSFTISVSLEGVRTTMLELGRHKAPRTDGYTMEFFPTSWDTVSDQVIAVVSDFFDYGMLTRRLFFWSRRRQIPPLCRISG